VRTAQWSRASSWRATLVKRTLPVCSVARERDLLDVPYVHVVFTLPHGLLGLAYRNSTRLYTWLFQASAATLREVAADPRHLGAEIDVLSILHTWGSQTAATSRDKCMLDGRRRVAPGLVTFGALRANRSISVSSRVSRCV
jgi:hypothetical protein